ncbi:MAG: BCCT family transporter [Treponemataceae bacterium]|nr:BCCT family transporter [Treponemataceae bacterium]
MMNRFSTTFTRSVALPGIILLILLSAFCGIFPAQTAFALQKLQDFLYDNVSWLYIFFVIFFLVFLLVLAFGKTGNIRLGADNAKPQHSFFCLGCHALFGWNGNIFCQLYLPYL